MEVYQTGLLIFSQPHRLWSSDSLELFTLSGTDLPFQWGQHVLREVHSLRKVVVSHGHVLLRDVHIQQLGKAGGQGPSHFYSISTREKFARRSTVLGEPSDRSVPWSEDSPAQSCFLLLFPTGVTPPKTSYVLCQYLHPGEPRLQ